MSRLRRDACKLQYDELPRKRRAFAPAEQRKLAGQLTGGRLCHHLIIHRDGFCSSLVAIFTTVRVQVNGFCCSGRGFGSRTTPAGLACPSSSSPVPAPPTAPASAALRCFSGLRLIVRYCSSRYVIQNYRFQNSTLCALSAPREHYNFSMLKLCILNDRGT